MSTPVSGIYAITHVASGKRYIGQSINIQNRWRIHRNELDRGEHHSPYLQRVWAKEGAAAFEFTVLEYVADIRLLNEREQHFLNERFAAVGSHEFNTAIVAGSPLGVKRPLELRQRWSEQRKGKPWSPSRRAKYTGQSDAQREQSKKVGQWMKDNAYSPEVYEQLTRKTPARLAHAQKLVRLQTGRPHTPEWSENISKGLRAC